MSDDFRPSEILEGVRLALDEMGMDVEEHIRGLTIDIDGLRTFRAAIEQRIDEQIGDKVHTTVSDRFDELYENHRSHLADMRVKAAETMLAFDRRFLELERRMVAECERLGAFDPPQDGETGKPGPPGKDAKGEKGDPGPAGLSFEPLGKYDETKAYHFRDVVAWNGGSWCAMRGTKAGEEPGVEADERNPAWMGFSQRGRPGKPGERGLQGKAGERGPVGRDGNDGERGERGASISAIAFDGWKLRVVDSDGTELDAAPFDAMRSLLDDLMSRIEAIELRGG